jgi:hypothetical protein
MEYAFGDRHRASIPRLPDQHRPIVPPARDNRSARMFEPRRSAPGPHKSFITSSKRSARQTRRRARALRRYARTANRVPEFHQTSDGVRTVGHSGGAAVVSPETSLLTLFARGELARVSIREQDRIRRPPTRRPFVEVLSIHTRTQRQGFSRQSRLLPLKTPGFALLSATIFGLPAHSTTSDIGVLATHPRP